MTTLNLKTDNGKDFKSFITALGILDELIFHVDKSGISIKAMDPSGISMVEAKIPAMFFTKYNVKEGIFEVQSKDIKGALKHIKKNNELSITTTDKKMKFSLPGKAEVEIPILTEVKEKEVKDVKIMGFTAEITVPAEPIKEFISQAHDQERILFMVKNKKLILFSEHALGKVRREIPIKGTIKKPTNVIFNLMYIDKIFKAANKDTDVKMELKTEEPIKISYNANGWHAIYWLAPYAGDDTMNWVKDANKGTKQPPTKQRLKA